MYKFERYRQIGLADFSQPFGLKINPENRIRDESMTYNANNMLYKKSCILYDYLELFYKRLGNLKMIDQLSVFFCYMIDKTLNDSFELYQWKFIKQVNNLKRTMRCAQPYKGNDGKRFRIVSEMTYFQRKKLDAFKREKYYRTLFYWYLLKIRDKVLLLWRRVC